MIPGLLAQDVAKSLREFIVTGFETDTWPFAGKFVRLVYEQNEGEAFIKGPYVSILLPFAKPPENRNFFPGFKTEHSPYKHQQQAWARLQSSANPKSTIVATGTGSGKTECFLYPLLDHCQRSKTPGIKAIIIYPMNALAGDQAKRFADVIHSTPELKGKVRVGLYVGGESENKFMSDKQVITCKKTLRKTPPDILLTNYKMLDFLLMRPDDQPLWQNNTGDTLKYLVVDELHTFDGAQGSDLAMLIRRLKARLNIQKDKLVCVGTSATLGSDSQIDDLTGFASDVFDASFDRSSIIGESRQRYDEFQDLIEYMMLDPDFSPEQLQLKNYASLDEYLVAQARLFFGQESTLNPQDYASRRELGQQLKKHSLVHNVLHLARNGPTPLSKLLPSVQKVIPAALKNYEPQVLQSLLALICFARGPDYPGQPFVTVRLQLWSRELRRIVSRVGDDSPQSPVHLVFADDLKSKTKNKELGHIYLPTVQCSECHTTAWLTAVEQGETHIQQDLKTIYSLYFSNPSSGDKRIRVLLPLKQPNELPSVKGLKKHLCSACGHLQINGGTCSSCLEEKLVLVFEPDLNKNVRRGGVPTIESQRMCPVCQADSSLVLFGSKAASLSSVAIHQMFANRINDDKKLVAFSDSVQDAAHRAGFFAARTWHNNIRMALAKTIHHYCQQHQSEIPLLTLYRYLPQFWMEEKDNPERLSIENYIVQFIAPNLQTDEDYLDLKEKGELDSFDRLLTLVNKRLIWETLSEFGMRSMIGRSLERTGVAAIYWDPEFIENAAAQLCSEAREQLGLQLPESNARYMLWGICLRMKRQGAIYHDFLKSYLEEGGSYYILNALPFLPKFGDYSVLPKFSATRSEKKLDPILRQKQQTWYIRWLQQLLPKDELVPNKIEEDLILLCMSCLVKSGLLMEIITKKGNTAWALQAEHLSISTGLVAVRLHREQSDEQLDSDNAHADRHYNDQDARHYGSPYIPTQWLESITGLPSLDTAATKSSNSNPARLAYRQNLNPAASMYREFYLNGEIQRVIGHEHTALLERGYRENLEQRFMAAPEYRKDWFENLLSATPTLEMGIDIGDLSSVLLCSVPPSQANYLQRAGRGGRKDGNSFVLTLANGRPHDLYFYTDPIRMLAGDVRAPAIFLNATMVLRRQLLAFCMDQWGVSLSGKHFIPGEMQKVLDAVAKGNLVHFPYTLLDFIEKHRDELWERFEALLGDTVLEETRARLKIYLLGSGAAKDEDPLRVYVLGRIQELVKSRESLAKHQKDLESELKSLRTRPEDESREELEKELERELEGIKKLKTDLNRKHTLNFLSDEGLLPNYAFPEEGATLRSVIFRRLRKPKAQEDGKQLKYSTTTFEYSRPAHAAISELAPDNEFYASNRKVRIERIEMARGENLELWRLCPNCDYSENIIGADKDANCPRCDDPMWADNGQLVEMVKLRQVYANTREEDAFISDDSDTREPTFYNKQMLMDYNAEDVLFAYKMKTDTKPFGFEFIKKAQFKEINFGKQGGNDQFFKVAGEDLARPGFRVCKECGTVQHRRNVAEHMYKCSYRSHNDNIGDDAEDDGIVNCLYLYRQYESEAIRIKMPSLSVTDREQEVQSLVAALQLGLQSRFGGKVDHLNILHNRVTESGAHYLVIYDAVPGGTGYLHTLLANPNNLMDMLKLSRQIMAECDCRDDPDADGCYSCLYAYKNSYGMENTSRDTALTILADILDEEVALEKVERLGHSATWADSELESRFPEALQSLHKHPALDGIRVRISKDIIGGSVNFKLEVGDLIYSMRTHVRLDKEQGVAYPCEPDFLISGDRENNKIQVAVFLDGYTYHRDIVHEDLMKRQGISLGTGILSWSLSWHDVNQAYAGNEAKIPNVLRENTANSHSELIKRISQIKKLEEHHRIAELNPLLLLLKLLSKPDMEFWPNFAALRVLNWLDAKRMNQESEKKIFLDRSSNWPSQFTDTFSGMDLLFCTSHAFESEPVDVFTFIAGNEGAIRDLDCDSLVLATVFDPKNTDDEATKTAWRKILQIQNIGQFLPKFFIGTRLGIENGNFANLQWNGKAEDSSNSEWDNVFTLVDEDIGDLVIELSKQDIPLPDVGYELTDERGAGLGEAELAWEKEKVAFFLDHQLENHSAFSERGWTGLSSSHNVKDIVSKLKGK